MTVTVGLEGLNPLTGDVGEINTEFRRNKVGIVAFTDTLRDQEHVPRPFLNDDNGVNMAVAVTFSGVPQNIVDGIDNPGWTPTIVQGIWSTANNTAPSDGTTALSLTNGIHNDQISFANSSSIATSGYTTLTGQVQLHVYNDTVLNTRIEFHNNNVLVGNPLYLDDFIDTGLFGTYQPISIGLDKFDLADETVDEMLITTERVSGTKSTISVDQLQLEQSGVPLTYSVVATKGKIFYVQAMVFTLADAMNISVTNGTAPGLPYDKFMDITALTNGFIIRRTSRGSTVFAATIRDLGNLLQIGAEMESVMCDGTNTFLNVRRVFDTPLEVHSESNDTIDLIVNDDLSGLLRFTCIAIGYEELAV